MVANEDKIVAVKKLVNFVEKEISFAAYGYNTSVTDKEDLRKDIAILITNVANQFYLAGIKHGQTNIVEMDKKDICQFIQDSLNSPK